MNVYFHFQFTGLHKNTTPIALGMCDELGRGIYAEFIDYDQSQVTDWIQENVMPCLWVHDKVKSERDYYHIGTREEIKEIVRDFLSEYDDVQLVSDVGHYDMTLLIDLFGSAFDLPKNVCHACHDINEDIASYYKISIDKAFDKSRIGIVGRLMNDVREKNYNAWDMTWNIGLIHQLLTARL